LTVDHELFEDRLPTYLTRFVGRTAEIDEVETLLRDGRLVTVCGVGGAGKTRLAIEVAKRWRSAARGDVHWVSLAEVDPGTLPRTIASALGLELGNVTELAVVVDALRGASALLLLDNCEDVADATGRMLLDLLAACPRVTALATSREPLRGPYERVFPIPPLGALASGADRHLRGEAADLFVERAVSVAPVYALTEANLSVIQRICERLDGLPLAIELAASWIRVVSPADLLAELERSTDLLTSDSETVAQRHRSMHAVLDSSWRWLGHDDQEVLAALGVFAGGFTREAAEAVAGAGLSSLASLIDRALIQRLPDSTGGTRYQVHELVRSYALERLRGAGEDRADAVRSRHLDFFLGLVESANAVWESPQGPAWLGRIRLEQANIDGAMSWALERQDASRALRMAAGLYSHWIFSSVPAQYAAVLDRALSLPARSSEPEAVRIRLEALNVAGFAAIGSGDLRLARSRFVDGLTLNETLDDPVLLSLTLRGLGHTLLRMGELDAARGQIERSLSVSRGADDLRGVAWGTHDLGELEFAHGHMERAEALLLEAMERFAEFGILVGTYRSEILRGSIRAAQEDWPAALTSFKKALDLAITMHFKIRVTILFEGLAEIATALQRPDLAARLLGAATNWRGQGPDGSLGATAGKYGEWSQPDYFNAAYRRAVTRSRRQSNAQEWEANHALGASWTSDETMQAADAAIRELSLALDRRAVGLTEREIAVLRLVALGLSNDDIADRLTLSPRTVHAHLRSIFDKLGVSTRTAAVHEATRLNLS